jgi:hypothetical protein
MREEWMATMVRSGSARIPLLSKTLLCKLNRTGRQKTPYSERFDNIDGLEFRDESPPELGGVPLRSKGGAVCSKTNSTAKINRYCSSLNRPPQPSLREGIPA